MKKWIIINTVTGKQNGKFFEAEDVDDARYCALENLGYYIREDCSPEVKKMIIENHKK